MRIPALLLILFSVTAYAEDTCIQNALTEKLDVQNDHVSYYINGSDKKYLQTARRSWETYESSLFKHAPKSKRIELDSFLGPNDLYLDSGAGTGVAAVRAHMNTKATVIAVNPLFHLTPQKELSELYLGHNGLGSDEIVQLNDQWLKIPYIADKVKKLGLTNEQAQTQYKTLFREAKEDAVSQLGKKILLVEDYSENELQKHKGQLKLVTDLWGAFSYSNNRKELVELIYDSLRSDGVALVGIPKVVQSTVHLKNAESRKVKSVPLDVFLTSRYPEVFSTWSGSGDLSGGTVLMIKKAPEREELRLPLKLIKKRAHPDSNARNWVVPKLDFEEM